MYSSLLHSRKRTYLWGGSSVGRARDLHSRGQGFKSPSLHHYRTPNVTTTFGVFFEYIQYRTGYIQVKGRVPAFSLFMYLCLWIRVCLLLLTTKLYLTPRIPCSQASCLLISSALKHGLAFPPRVVDALFRPRCTGRSDAASCTRNARNCSTGTGTSDARPAWASDAPHVPRL